MARQRAAAKTVDVTTPIISTVEGDDGWRPVLTQGGIEFDTCRERFDNNEDAMNFGLGTLR